MSEESAGGAVTSRADRAAAAAEGWAEQLAGLGGRSTLLHFRDLKTGTLDLAAADAEARRRLVEGHPTPVSRLFPHEPLRSSATRSARAVRDKARELADERGLQTCFLAVGIATWSDPFAARRPTAPVLLRPARLAQVGGAGSDLLVTVSTEAQVNPVLLRSMADQLGLRIEPDDLLDAAGELRYTTVVEKLREFAPPHVVDGFSVAHRAVLGTFSNAAVSLRDDLLGAAGQLASHDVVSAVAGDESALAALRHRESRSAHGVRELLVVDADAGQEAAVRGAAAGDAVLLGTPGTGMTQTLVNLVATVVGQGRRVLVVAARRDDASALVRRLDHLGLGGPVLDGDEGRPRAELVADLGGLLRPVATGDHPRTGARAAVSLASREPDLEAATDAVSARRDSLAAHRDTMHRPREPWGISAYAAQAAVAGAAEAVRCAARLDGTAVRQLHGERRSAARAALREFNDLGGLALGPDDSPWYGSTPTGPAAARETADRVVRLRDRGLPELRDVATRAAVEVGLPGPATPAEAVGSVRLLDRAAALLRTFGPELWAADLDALVAATADRAWRREHGSSLGWLTRRRLRVEADALLRPHGGARPGGDRPGGDRPGRADLHGRLVQARELRAEWSARARDGKPPRVGSHHADARAASADTTDDLEALAATNPRTAGLAELPWAEAHRRLGVLAADEWTLLTVPRLRELEASLSAAGLGALVEELRGRSPDTATAVATLDHAWHASLVDLWREEDPSYGAVEAQSLDAEVAAFGEADLRLQAAAVATVHRVHEAAVASAVEQNPGQAALVAAQTAVTTQVRGTPDLVRAAPELILALKPCWVVSPYAVADLLPPQRLFDVVVVAGAGALRPAEAVPALLRGEHVVLCGGAHEQVPPPYSVPVEQEPVDDDAPARAPEESLLAVLGPSLPVHELSWQHAARDERLVAFANSSVHAGRLVTTPAASVDASAVRHVLVAGRTSGDDPVDSAGAEVQRVVELVLDHARTRPYESLAVVTLGPDHARRVAAAVRAALSREPDLDAFFTEDGDEPFVVTHLGRPPVGARDAVVLTLGYGRTVDGRVLYRFGPLAHPGGDVRLAAVLARARMRFTLVSSFSSADLNERRLTSEGPRVLRDLLAYVERGARDGTGVGSDVADPLEDAVRTRLAAAGITPVTHLGTSSRRVGLALPHPVRPRRFVLAVDTDGPAWAAAGSVRESVRIVPEELERRGWRTHRVWSAAWAADPDGETRRLLEAYERAVEAADGYDAAVAAAVNDAVVGLPDAAVESARAQGTVRSPRPRGARPPVRPGRDASGYSLVELVALARWVESDAGLRTEGEAADELARELDLVPAGARVDALLRHAVRAGRAAGGGPDRLDLPAVDGSVRSEGPPEAGTPADGGTSPEDETPSEAEQSSDSAKPSDAEPPADAWEPGREVEAQVTGPELPPAPDQSTAEEEQAPDADMGTPPGPDPSEPIRGNEPR